MERPTEQSGNNLSNFNNEAGRSVQKASSYKLTLYSGRVLLALSGFSLLMLDEGKLSPIESGMGLLIGITITLWGEHQKDKALGIRRNEDGIEINLNK